MASKHRAHLLFVLQNDQLAFAREHRGQGLDRLMVDRTTCEPEAVGRFCARRSLFHVSIMSVLLAALRLGAAFESDVDANSHVAAFTPMKNVSGTEGVERIVRAMPPERNGSLDSWTRGVVWLAILLNA